MIIEQSKEALHKAGLPDRDVVITAGEMFRPLSEREKRSKKASLNAQRTASLCGGDWSPVTRKEPKRVAKRRADAARKFAAKYGALMIKVRGARWRDVMPGDREDPDTAPLIAAPGFGAEPYSAEWFAADAIRYATIALQDIQSGRFSRSARSGDAFGGLLLEIDLR